jgi:hypothetical protein
MTELVAAWEASVGEAIAANAWPARATRDGTLIVHVSSSIWAYELTQLEASIRDRLGLLAPARLRFVPGPMPAGGTVPDLQRSALSVGPAERSKGEALAREIEAPGLRAAVARAAAASFAAAACRGEADRPV